MTTSSKFLMTFLLLLCILQVSIVDSTDNQPDSPLSFLPDRVQVGPAHGTATHVIDSPNLANITQNDWPDPRSFLKATGAWIASLAQENGPLTMVVAVAFSDSIPLLPTQPICILSGAVFGAKIGLPAVMLGQAFATAFAMLVGRYLVASDWKGKLVSREEGDDKEKNSNKNANNRGTKLSKVLEELTAGLNSEDWRIVFGTILLARQSPVLPFSLGNYFIGASSQASVLLTVAATVLGCLPLNTIWVGAGAGGVAAVDAMKENGFLAHGLEIVGLVATAAIFIAIAVVVLKVWKQEQEEEEEALPSESSALLVAS